MTKGTGFRPKLFPPRGRTLQRNQKPFVTCFLVSLSIATLILVVFGLTAYNIYHNRFGVIERTFHSGDMVSLREYAKDLSPIFCSGYTVELKENSTAFLLPSKAELDIRHLENFTLSLIFQPLREDFRYRIYYLLPKSRLSVTACRIVSGERSSQYDDDVEMGIIIGADIFKNWLRNPNSKYFYKNVSVPINAMCEKPFSPLPQLDIVVQFPDTYHIVLYSRHRPRYIPMELEREISMTANISRTRYNVSSALSICSSTQKSCYFPLSWEDSEDVVVEIGDHSEQQDTESTFNTDCNERVVFWVCIFGVLPLTLVLLSSLCCTYVLVCNRSLESKYQLESGSTSHGYGSTENCRPLRSAAQTEDEYASSIQD